MRYAFLLALIQKLPGPEKVKKLIHDVMVVIAYIWLILDYILKNPPTFLK